MKQKHDLIVVGGGHAGVEAANISSKIGCKTTIVTMDKNSIGRMSCNPAIGGIAKGQPKAHQFSKALKVRYLGPFTQN